MVCLGSSTCAENTGDLTRGCRDIEPVERFAYEDGVDRVVGERYALGGAVEQSDLGKPRGELGAHLDRDQLTNAITEQPRQLAGPRRQIEHR